MVRSVQKYISTVKWVRPLRRFAPQDSSPYVRVKFISLINSHKGCILFAIDNAIS